MTAVNKTLLYKEVRQWVDKYYELSKGNFKSEERETPHLDAVCHCFVLDLLQIQHEFHGSESPIVKASLYRALIELLADLNAICKAEEAEQEAKKYMDFAISFIKGLEETLSKNKTGTFSNNMMKKRLFRISPEWNGSSLMSRIDNLDKGRDWINRYDVLCHFTHLSLIRGTGMISELSDVENEEALLTSSLLLLELTLSSNIYSSEQKQKIKHFLELHKKYSR